MFKQAHDDGAIFCETCKTADITECTLKRWKTAAGPIKAYARTDAVRPTPGHAFSEAKRAEVLSIANETRFAHHRPRASCWR